jgi:hypothetical protein
MRIVSRKEFLEMPSGTIFLKYSPINFGELCIKGETCKSSFITDDFFLTCIPCANAFDTGEMIKLFDNAEKDSSFSIPLDFETMGRDGLWDKDQKFAILEKHDIETFITVLRAAIR